MSMSRETATGRDAIVQRGMDGASLIIEVWIDYLRRSDRTFIDYLGFLKGVAAEHSVEERDFMLLVTCLRLLDAEKGQS
jgi:hypothetical protein